MCPGEETVAAYVAGRLARDERDRFDAHLDTCSACHELLAALGKLGTGTSLGVGSVPGELDEAASWAPGDQLGRYVLLAQLGEGGMGVVYAAYDPELDRKVAIKLVRHASEAARQRLRDEARAIAKLAHPNVVAVHDVGDAGGDVYVAMEHVEGATFDRWLRGRRDVRAILDAFVQAGRGLAAAHAVGLVHRDVKPQNLIVGKDGRARVLDFGLAPARGRGDGVVGTPAYMAPEQQRGEAVDARADQYAFAVALWEAVGGVRPGPDEKAALPGVPERVVRALRRALAARPEARFAAMSELLHELAPPSPRWRWLAPLAGGGALAAAAIVLVARGGTVPTCERAGDPIEAAWGEPQRAALREAFARTQLPYAGTAATAAITELDAWTARWRTSAEATCRATVVDRVQAAELDGLRRGCLEQLRERFTAIVAVATRGDATVIANASAIAAALPAPERCDDVAGLAALPAEGQRDELAALRQAMATTEAELIAGKLDAVRPEALALARRAEALGYLPLQARGQLLVARLELAGLRTEPALAALHAGARLATAARDLPLLAEIWIELAQALGNDPATLAEAAIFDGYAAALVERLPDRDALALQLAFARCNRNLGQSGRADGATAIVDACRAVIAGAGPARRPALANAARVRLGHFQRLLGDPEAARATLREAIDEAVRVHGAQHPDTAVARNAYGLAELSADRVDEAITELAAALAIRRAAFPGHSLYTVESLQALADARSTKGDAAGALALLEEARGMLDALGKGKTVLAINVHILLGLTLSELGRDAEALPHLLLAADLADREVPGRELLAVVALTLAIQLAEARGELRVAIEHAERGLRLLERGKATPLERGKLQAKLAALLVAPGGPGDRARARALADAARASFTLAGDAGTPHLAALAKQRY